MSRIGKNPILIPESVICSIKPGGLFEAKGNLGSLALEVPLGIKVLIEENYVFVKPNVKTKKISMLWGTVRSLLNNIIKGVHIGFTKSLEINGVGYRAYIKGESLVLNLGYSHEVVYTIPTGISIICKKPTVIDIFGMDHQLVGQVASKIRSFRKPEPYKGKGIKYVDEIIFRKEGKKK